MKKLKCVLLSVCLLGTMFSFTSCGDESDDKKWVRCKKDNFHVSNDVEDIVSDNKADNIVTALKKKYRNADVFTNTYDYVVKGLLEEDIDVVTIEDYDEYETYMWRAKELDSIFEVEGHKVTTYVNVDFGEDFMEYEIYALYDGNEDNDCFAEIDFEPAEE